MKKIIAIDLDGTLLDSRSRHSTVLNFCLQKRNIDIPTDALVTFKSDGKNNKDYLFQFLKEENLVNEIQKEWISLIEDDSFLKQDMLYSDSFKFLEEVFNVFDIVLITSRSNVENTLKQIESLKIKPFFKEIIIVKGGKGADHDKKEALKKVKAFAMVGDTEIDANAALSLDIKFIALHRGFRSQKFWENRNIKSFESLKEVLKVIT